MRIPVTKYPERIVQEAALAWLKDRHTDESFLLDLCLFHDKRISLVDYVRATVPEHLWRTVPWWANLAIRPDVVGLVKLPDTALHGWILAECKSATVRPRDVRQAQFYAEMADAYAAYMFWDMEAGFTREAFEGLSCSGRAYKGINRGGVKVDKPITYVMYDKVRKDLIDDLEAAFVVRMCRLR